jgi:hypothetical protein
VREARSDNDPAAPAGNLNIDNGLEPEPVHEEPPAQLLVTNPEGCEIEPKERLQYLGWVAVTQRVSSVSCVGP